MESEDHGRGGRKHHCHQHHNPDHNEKRRPQTRCRRRHRHVHAVAVLLDKDCPRRCRERHEEEQYGVALKSEQIWLGFIQSNVDLWGADRAPILAQTTSGSRRMPARRSKSIVCFFAWRQ